MAALEYRVRLTPLEIFERLHAVLGDVFVGTISPERFSLQERRLWMESAGRVIRGVIHEAEPGVSVISITIRPSAWTRFTIRWFFSCLVLMQILCLFILADGIRHGSMKTVLIGLMPVVPGLLGYLALRSGWWTGAWTDRFLLEALDRVLGDAAIGPRPDPRPSLTRRLLRGRPD